MGHTSGTLGAGEDRVYRGSNGVLLIGACQRPGKARGGIEQWIGAGMLRAYFPVDECMGGDKRPISRMMPGKKLYFLSVGFSSGGGAPLPASILADQSKKRGPV